jgi:TRAP-type uncharacterized transport system substrate-binding protein
MRLRIAVITVAAALLWLPSPRAAEADWPQSIAIATASPGGVYYVYGQALADIPGKELDIEVTAPGDTGSDPQHHPDRDGSRRARPDYDGHRLGSVERH